MQNKLEAKDFTIENLTPQMGTIYPRYTDKVFTGYDSNVIILDFGKKTKQDILVCNMSYISKNRIVSTGASCGCTRPSFQAGERPDEQIVTIDFDSSKVEQNVSKVATLRLDNGKVIKINLYINKNV